MPVEGGRVEAVLTGNINQMVLSVSQKQKAKRKRVSPFYREIGRRKRTRWRGWREKRLEERARAGPQY